MHISYSSLFNFPFRIISYHITPHSSHPHHISSHHFTPHYITTHHTTSHHTTPLHITPHRITSHHTTLFIFFLTAVVAWISAPMHKSSFTVSIVPYSAACMRGVYPCWKYTERKRETSSGKIKVYQRKMTAYERKTDI